MIIDDQKVLADNFKYMQFLWQVTNMKPYCDYPPHQFFVEPTNVCNLRCEMCIQDEMTRTNGYMEFDLIKKIIDEVSVFNPYFDFCRQGEPLVHPKIVEMIEYAIRKGLTKTRLITNGKILRENISTRLIKSGLHKINISFNGYDRESYERYQKGSNFNKVMKNIINLLKLKYELGAKTPEVEISLVLYKDLKDKSEKYFDLFRQLPVDRIRVSKLISFLGSNEDKALDENIKKEYKEWPSCKVPFRFYNINWNGDVTPCIVDYDSRYIVGNLKKSSVLEIWNNDKMQFFRDCHINKKFDEIQRNSKGLFCEYCSQLWIDPNDNGPQYPSTLEQGIRDLFEKNNPQGKDMKTMAGNYASDMFRTKKQVNELGQKFLKEFDSLYETIITNA